MPGELLRFENLDITAWADIQPAQHFSLEFPIDQRVTSSISESFLSAVSGLHLPLAFEITGSQKSVHYQLTCSALDAQALHSAAQMHWPKAGIEVSDDKIREAYLSAYPTPEKRPSGSFVVDFGLQQFAYLPLAVFENFAIDPLSSVVAALGQLAEGEIAGVQVLLTPAGNDWSNSLFKVALEFEQFPEAASSRSVESGTLRLAKAKLSQPLYAVSLRVWAMSRTQGCTSGEARSFALCKQIGGALAVFNTSGSNSLIALANENPKARFGHHTYPNDVHMEDVMLRRSRRTGMLLSLTELAGVVHPPSETLTHPKLVRLDPHEVSLPEHLLEAEGITLGMHPYRNETQELVWPDAFRNRHAYVLGATRMGKSTLLHNLIVQDMKEGRGLCLIDPHGDLALDVLAHVPAERVEDALYLDLSDHEFPLALGLLEAHDEYEQRLLCSDVLSVLRRLFAASWGDRLEHILRHAILTLLAAGARGETYSLRDIRPLLSNKAFRKRVVEQISEPDLKAFWTSEFLGYTSSHFSPLYNKLGLLLSSPVVKNIVAGRKSKLAFSEVMQGKKILIVNLASSQIGSDNAHFLGALLVSKLQIAAMQSLRLSRADRTPFTLYVDEFQNFVVSSFQIILSEAGKAGLSLMMANQFLEQLNPLLQTAILSNVGTMVSFRVSSDSGRLLEKEFAGRFKGSELVSLNRGQAVARVGSAQDTFFINTLPPPEQADDPAIVRHIMEAIRDQSRELICRPRHEVEVELATDAARQEEELAVMEWEERAEKEGKAEKASQEKQAERDLKAAAKRASKTPDAVQNPAAQGVASESSSQSANHHAAPPAHASSGQVARAEVPMAQAIGVELSSSEPQDMPMEPEAFGVAN